MRTSCITPRIRVLCLFLIFSTVTACTPTLSTPDPAQLALAVSGTLQVVGTQLAGRETLTATALDPTHTNTPTITPTPTNTATPTLTPTSTSTLTPLPSGFVKGPGPLRYGPGKVYPAVVNLVGGEEAGIVGQTRVGDWLNIQLEDGTVGWLPASNVEQDDPTLALPVISDLPPTPTLPPPTPTPLPTASNTPSPYTCDFYITFSGAPGDILLIGTNWPPSTDFTVTIGTQIYYNLSGQTDANGSFTVSTPHTSGITRQFTVSTAICFRTVQFP